MKCTDLFVRCLENEGIECIFGVPELEVVGVVVGEVSMIQAGISGGSRWLQRSGLTTRRNLVWLEPPVQNLATSVQAVYKK